MEKWYYYNKNGERGGPISPTALKELARQGLITRKTRLENEVGEFSVAEDMDGITFLDAPSPQQKMEILLHPIPVPPPLPSTTEPNPFTAPPPPVSDNPFTLPPPVVK